MQNKNIILIVVLLVPLIIFEVWLFGDFRLNTTLYVLLASVLLAIFVFRFFSFEVRKIQKINAGLIHVLEKSEEGRINAEKLKSKVLLMVDDLPDGLLIVSRDDEVLVINNKAEKFLGINKRKVLNKSILELRNLFGVQKVVLPLLFNFKGVHQEEIEVKKNLILKLTIEPLVLSKNNIAKLIILQDITKIKLAEEAKNQFVSVAAHQLKAPLSVMRTSLKMMIDQDFGKINQEQRSVLEKTYKKNESLIYLVEYLLKEAREDEPGNYDNKSLTNLEDLVVSVIDFYKDEIERKKINFKFNKSEKNLPKVVVDPERIKMVVQNLFDNAVKYTPIKGRIEVGIKVKKDELEFGIKDSGVGIPEDQKEKIFTKFSRIVNAVGTKAEGSGLGLVIAKDIIEKHHGKMWFESKEGEGSTFYFVLPF